MARPGITYIDVSKAAEKISNNKMDVTVDRVREELGTGSKSTIAPLLKRWKTLKKSDEKMSAIPDDVLKAISDWYLLIQEKMNSELAKEKSKYDEKKSALNEEKKGFINTIKQHSEKEKELKDKINQLQDQLTNLTDQFQAEKIKNAQISEKHQHTQRSLNENKQALNEKQEQLSHLQKQYDHYQEKTMEERSKEIARFSESQSIMEAHIQQLSLQITERSRQYESLEAKLDRSLSENKELRSIHQNQVLQLQEIDSEKNHHQQVAVSALNEIKELENQISIMSQTLNTAKESESHINSQHKELQNSLKAQCTENRHLTEQLALKDKQLKDMAQQSHLLDRALSIIEDKKLD